MTWAVCENGKDQHVFEKLAKPFKMMGQLVRWASICGRSFAIKQPLPNPKRKKCEYCLELENGKAN